jgi:GntR family transcriptional regulator/MocR family aminotransferase
MLVEQIRTRILPRRGILVDEDQILVTMGAQMALYLIASLLVDAGTRLAIEEPGYPDVRNIFRLRTQNILSLPVDAGGMPVDQRLNNADIVYTTPSHQFPTTVTMPMQRRKNLLKAAKTHDFLIIEDDYELETNYQGKPVPALKSLDRDGRVIYVGSFSKTLFPGLRLGFMVAPKEFIKEARALRRLMARHPPSNNQRITSFFLSLGYYDVHLRRLHRVYRQRWQAMEEALSMQDAIISHAPGYGGTSFWVKGPRGLNAEALAEMAQNEGIIIEPGSVYFAQGHRPDNHFRLGFSSIPSERIGEGIEKLAALMASMVEN